MRLSLSELADFAKRYVTELKDVPGEHAHVTGLMGNLGAGKTTFVQLIAKELGVQKTVQSPTFTLLQAYPIQKGRFKKLIHIDAYRLSPGEKDTIGWSDYVNNPENLIFVEWPENLPGGFPKEFPTIGFSVVDEHTRDIAHYGNE